MQDEPTPTPDAESESLPPREPRAPFCAFITVMVVMAVLNFWPRNHIDGVLPGSRATAVGLPWTYWERGIFPVSETRGTGTITTRFFPLWFAGDVAMAVVIASLAATSSWYVVRNSEESGIREPAAETADAA